MNRTAYCFLLLYGLSACAERKKEAVAASQETITASLPLSPDLPDTDHWPSSFGFGRRAPANTIAAWDIDVRPDGKGLPKGSGTVPEGERVYLLKCAACHGPTGVEGPYGKLVGVQGDTTQAKTIGNYWPYATTLFDYIRRAMPYNTPGSLTNEEVYSLTTFLLYANRIIDKKTIMNKRNLSLVSMPARSFFVDDDRRGGPKIR